MGAGAVVGLGMTKLRQQLIDFLTLKGYSPKTHEAYVESVAGLAGFHQRPPDQLSDEQIKNYLLALHAKGYAASTLNVRVSGLRFFYRHVLGRSIAAVEASLPRPRRQIRRARVYSLDVEAQHVVQWQAESGDGGAEFEGVVRTVPVVVVKEGWEAL